MADTMSKFFETRWKAIEKKLPEVDECFKHETKVPLPESQLKKRNIAPLDHNAVTTDRVKQRMTMEDRERLGTLLVSWMGELPAHIVDFLRQHCSNVNSEDEIEVDIHTLGEDTLSDLQKLLDDFLLERKKSQQVTAEQCDMEVLNVSGVSNPSMRPCRDSLVLLMEVAHEVVGAWKIESEKGDPEKCSVSERSLKGRKRKKARLLAEAKAAEVRAGKPKHKPRLKLSAKESLREKQPAGLLKASC
ncbi:Transcription factor GTE8 [Ananas comosus]|uniref:Transcription factor GTE8 n=1 Tax=Ananas comosus TaxID=4615 RepID=A0A199UFK6_ANACO|nr:Transcription factor GTE8 [Ananas comosus]